MVKINQNYNKLVAGYLFAEIRKRRAAFAEHNPDKKIISLGIGDTTQPLTPTIIHALKESVDRLSKIESYSGYGDEQGNKNIREELVSWYKKLGVTLDVSEVFISDGAKADIANIQSIFSDKAVVAVQDPVYPVYVDTNVVAGRTGSYDAKSGKYAGLVYMPCTETNNFFPDVPKEKADIIYLCSPNNPTGAVATKEQLKRFVDYANKNKSIIIFDAAYQIFVKDKSLPKTIYEIEGAKSCAIEINSFSKWAGFTGVRLGWTIVPKSLVAEDAESGKINNMWNRRQTTFFNGASNIAQDGGLAALSQEGQKECQKIADYYMDNAKLIKETLESIGLKCYGGENAPYVWAKTPNGMSSWDFFDLLLNKTYVVATPGSGFGPSGEGFIRFSAFGKKNDTVEALDRIKRNLKF